MKKSVNPNKSKNKTKIIIIVGGLAIAFIFFLTAGAGLYYYFVYLVRPDVVLSRSREAARSSMYTTYTLNSVTTPQIPDKRNVDITTYGKAFYDMYNETTFVTEGSYTDAYEQFKIEGIEYYITNEHIYGKFDGMHDDVIVNKDNFSWIKTDDPRLDANHPELYYVFQEGNVFDLQQFLDRILLDEGEEETYAYKEKQEDGTYMYERTLNKEETKELLFKLTSQYAYDLLWDQTEVSELTIKLFVDPRKGKIQKVYFDFSEVTIGEGKNELVSSFSVLIDDITWDAESNSSQIPQDKDTITYEEYLQYAYLAHGDVYSEVTFTIRNAHMDFSYERYLHPTYPDFKKNYIDKNKVKYILKPPQSAGRGNDFMENYNAYLCAFEQNKGLELYKAVTDYAFDTKLEAIVRDKRLTKPPDADHYLKLLGKHKDDMNIDQFTKCVTDTQYEEAINEQIEETQQFIESKDLVDRSMTILEIKSTVSNYYLLHRGTSVSGYDYYGRKIDEAHLR